ncbi:SMI1/KNR4 family protein [Streptomyces sp. SHP 1-2]|uniref:SMI1/KNR4 family protein n=1 Tax=Streptomyces sp. SHP 1-2 TaxID=2769489 RepID=UPI002238A297|nr:SMI1/KNR4 family protein [Streptomyces sp. SHP 1-2]MCW5250954.1 hypothetical protein [Streptomyces sp. SHP 1-2]
MDADTADTTDIAEFAEPSAERPPAAVPVDWAAVEAWLGTRLPGDYRRLADRYGPLDFGRFLWIHVPCAQDGRFDYGDWLRAIHRETRIARRDLPAGERRPVHPEPGGLLAWGYTRATDVLFWDTSVSADPDAWTVVVRHRDGVPGGTPAPWQAYDLTLTAYLRQAVRADPDPAAPVRPLPGVFGRTAFLPAAAPWTPPEPVPPRLTEGERRVALETGTGLDALRLLTPPPARPHLGDGDWERTSGALGLALPGEYVRLMETYGAGCWNRWLCFPPPLGAPGRDLATHAEEILAGYEVLRADDPEDFPLVTWPRPGGFLPFAHTVDGDHLGWLTTGDDPDAWPLTVWPRHADQGPPLEQGLTDTLLRWQRGRLSTAGLYALDEEDDPVECARFTPWPGRAD